MTGETPSSRAKRVGLRVVAGRGSHSSGALTTCGSSTMPTDPIFLNFW